MSDWRTAQRDVAAALDDPRHDERAALWIRGDPAVASERLSIYRANVAAAASRALAAAYPVLQQVVGSEFFAGLAQVYRRRHPSQSGDLNEFGAALAECLAGFEAVAHLPYLPDLARLEWAVHLAGGAADGTVWDIGTLASVAAERQNDIRFRFAPGTALVVSQFPLVRIWQIHQPAHDGDFDVDWRLEEAAWVTRPDLQVAVEALPRGAAACLGTLLAGSSLGEAVATALAADADFDLASLLQRLLASKAIMGFDLV
ncbi:MAG: DNA-binding domain-containing protein [Pseudomonadota bacterium]|nr:DNA-binding domain-containing protein [Pseudomonadota bacterium]